MKPVRPKPMLYAWLLKVMQEKSREMGYNLVLHGSLSRDCDLIAVAWVDNPASSFDLVNELCYVLRGYRVDCKEHLMYSVLPGNRESYVINLNRQLISEDHPDWKEGLQEDEQYYLDISVVNANHKT